LPIKAKCQHVHEIDPKIDEKKQFLFFHRLKKFGHSVGCLHLTATATAHLHNAGLDIVVFVVVVVVVDVDVEKPKTKKRKMDFRNLLLLFKDETHVEYFRDQFHQHFISSFYVRRSQKRKKD